MSNYLYQRLIRPFEKSDQTFLILENEIQLSYERVNERANQLALSLIKNGLKAGDRVAVQVNKSWQALALYLGTIKAGGVFLPLNNAYTATEIEYFVTNAEPKILVCDQTAMASLEAMAENSGTHLLTLNQDGSGTLADSADSCDINFDAVAREKDDLAAILYTSGTTGRSKGAMLTHHNLWSNAEVLATSWQFTKDDVLLHALPIFHTHG
ncbi:MAG: AMP-binding protein, partial [bacterium]